MTSPALQRALNRACLDVDIPIIPGEGRSEVLRRVADAMEFMDNPPNYFATVDTYARPRLRLGW